MNFYCLYLFGLLACFADDSEYIELLQRAINENMKPADIKKAIKKWKADHHRA